VLCNYGMVEADERDTESRGYGMHGCVHSWTYEHLYCLLVQHFLCHLGYVKQYSYFGDSALGDNEEASRKCAGRQPRVPSLVALDVRSEACYVRKQLRRAGNAREHAVERNPGE
jgi:hypothetical protein